MEEVNDAGRAAPLVLELASGTAVLHGGVVELPLREFRLLAELAARVGEVVASPALIASVWPDAPWTTPQDLYVLVSKLRRLIDGGEGFGSNIRNRRGFGYVLDLPPDDVVIVDTPTNSVDRVIDVRDEPPPGHRSDTEGTGEPEVEAPVPTSPGLESRQVKTVSRKSLRAASATAVVGALLAGSWFAGYVLSAWNSSPSERDAKIPQAPQETETQPGHEQAGSGPLRGKAQNQPARKPRPRREDVASRGGPPVVDAAPGTSLYTGDVTAPPAPSQRNESRKRRERGPTTLPLPPAPTRYLYHLVNQKTGDHFVTTDGNAASEQEAKGYEGGAIARVYTYQEEGTKAITTNYGAAYVFIGAAPKTDPESRALTLWYSTNNNGDFFYAIHQSEAKQTGWSGSMIGYVRSL